MGERLFDRVRQVMALDRARASALGDPEAKRALFERIVRTPVTAPVHAARRPYRRWAFVIAAGAVAAVMATVVLSRGWGREPVPPGQSRGDVFGAGSANLSCVESYTPESLARRSFAFAGTVSDVGARAAGGDPFVPVTFQVHQWFRGGRGESVTVTMLPPEGNISAGGATYAVGSRLLVSGEPRFGGEPLADRVAWACGYTRWYDEAEAEVWRESFDKPPSSRSATPSRPTVPGSGSVGF